MKKSENITKNKLLKSVFLKNMVILIQTVLFANTLSAAIVQKTAPSSSIKPSSPTQQNSDDDSDNTISPGVAGVIGAVGGAAVGGGIIGAVINNNKNNRIQEIEQDYEGQLISTKESAEKDRQLYQKDLMREKDFGNELQSRYDRQLIIAKNRENEFQLDNIKLQKRQNETQEKLSAKDQELKNLNREVNDTFFDDIQKQDKNLIKVFEELEYKFQCWNKVIYDLSKDTDEKEISEVNDKIRKLYKLRLEFTLIPGYSDSIPSLKDRAAKSQESMQRFKELGNQLLPLQDTINEFFHKHNDQITAIIEKDLQEEERAPFEKFLSEAPQRVRRAQENVKFLKENSSNLQPEQRRLLDLYENTLERKKQDIDFLKSEVQKIKQEVSSVDKIKDPEEVRKQYDNLREFLKENFNTSHDYQITSNLKKMKQQVEESRKGMMPPVIIDEENRGQEAEAQLRRTRNDRKAIIKEENRKEERLEVFQKHPEEQEKPAFEHPEPKKGNSSKPPHENSEHSHSNNIHEK